MILLNKFNEIRFDHETLSYTEFFKKYNTKDPESARAMAAQDFVQEIIKPLPDDSSDHHKMKTEMLRKINMNLM